MHQIFNICDVQLAGFCLKQAAIDLRLSHKSRRAVELYKLSLIWIQIICKTKEPDMNENQPT
jgi:hypothetical protein